MARLFCMNQQLAYAIITPYTIRKSRTGAVLARLLSRVSSELVCTQMFAPTKEMALAFSAGIKPGATEEEEKYRALIRDYVLQNLSPDSSGRRHRVLMLVFRGENAIEEVSQAVGYLRISSATGETIRDTYGDLVWNPDGTVRYFEPAVLIGDSVENTLEDLKLWMDFAATQSPILTNICVYDQPVKIEQTLVIIKPDSWRQKSSRPGAIIDMFSRTGLRIIACRFCRMSVAQAMTFYGPVRDVLCRKIAPGIGVRAREVLEEELGIKLDPGVDAVFAEKVGIPYALDQFERIVEFMSGHRPSACPQNEWEAAGTVTSMVLVYEGENAVQKIRDVLGPTDPHKAPSGTVRREFGSDVMVNTAHASDSPENARREMTILGIGENQFLLNIKNLLRECANG